MTYLLVCVVFVILRRREPGMHRPFVAGGSGARGTALGVAGVVLCAGLLSLYIPGMPASISPASYILFVAWWVLGAVFLLRIPRGIAPGQDAEDDLHRALEERNARGRR
ncbi:hypothetical protein ACHAAC_04410 [Aeromicrobium sp. CF4.19]|uniref:hypothetical protein n=1 Tax=Aeromicrobium sp. CF4.19 TaxID=3373082 RepID=UPI003EE71E12